MKKVLFVCVENTCRSQMAKGFFNRYALDAVSDSAGTNPAERIDPLAVQVMNERGIDINGYVPQMLTFSMINEFDYIVTMGCMDGCPLTPRSKTIPWEIEDPKGKIIDDYRRIRDQIKNNVTGLIKEI
ncbi:MAG: arsenate reductase ArsC [Thermoplasmatota archaeon]